MLAAFDASDDEATPILTVAGFVSSAKDWEDFSAPWRQRLSSEGIEYFRTAEAAHFRGQFQPWHDRPDRNPWRNQLCADLMDILKRHVFRKFGCTVINQNLSLLSENNRRHFKLSAYVVAGRNCDKQVREWARDERLGLPIELVFEAGDQGQTDLSNRLLVDTGREPTFKRKKDTALKNGSVELGFVPLQAADWLAYEIQHATAQFEQDKLEEFRWPLQEFERLHGELTTYTVSDMKEMDKLLDASREINKFAAHLERLRSGAKA